MLIKNNTLIEIYNRDIIDGVFTAPDEVLYISDNLNFTHVKKMILPNVVEIGKYFLYFNTELEYLELPKVRKIDSYFLFYNYSIKHLNMPNLETIGDYCLSQNILLEEFIAPNINTIGIEFLRRNKIFKYSSKILKALIGNMYVGDQIVNKKEYIRKINLNKILDK